MTSSGSGFLSGIKPRHIGGGSRQELWNRRRTSKAEISVGARPLVTRSVVHLDPAKADAAKLKAISNNMDDLFIQVGSIFPKKYVASSDGIAKGVSIGQEITVDGKKGVVTDRDDESYQLAVEKVAGPGIGLAFGVAFASLAKAKPAVALVVGGAMTLAGYFGIAKLRDCLRGLQAEAMKEFEKK